jgi:hypothetical protein
MTTIITSVTVNYLPKARVLADSIKRFHPSYRMVLLLCDEVPAWFDLSTEPFDELLTLDDIGLSNRHAFTFKHSVVEVCTAAKPFAMRHLLAQGAGSVFYFDPDTVLFSDISWLQKRLDAHGILLTPTMTSPESTRRAIVDNEISCLKYGMFNLGFIGLNASPESMRFVRWWSERLQDWCHDDVANGLFTDQRWADFVPLFFPTAHTLREKTVNVAPWNLGDRHVTGNFTTGFFVNGEPLSYYHFSAVDRLDHHSHEAKLSRYGASMPALTLLLEWYRGATERHGQKDLGKVPWSYRNYSDGTPIEAFHRWVYRDAPNLEERFPEPERVDVAPNFRAWLLEHHPFGLEQATWPEFARTTLRRSFAHLHRALKPQGWQSRMLRGLYDTVSEVDARLAALPRRGGRKPH